MEGVDIPAKVLQFEAFVNDVLREELKRFESLLDGINTEIAEYIELKTMLNTISSCDFGSDGFKTQVDLGCNHYVQAHVKQPSVIYVDIGLGHYLEMHHTDACKFANGRIDLLNRKADILRKNSARTKAHIKYLLTAIGTLQQQPQPSGQ